MNKLKQTGVRISQYPLGPVNNSTHVKRLELAHSFITYAPAYFGTSTINKNFQIPLQTLRQDMMGTIGILNSKPAYRNYVKVWYGDWYNSDRVKSYIYQWSDTEKTNDDYVPNKHGIDITSDDNNNIDRVFFLTDAPIPLEATYTPVNPPASQNYGKDPNVRTSKFVTKKYIDDRHNGVRKIQKGDISNPTPIQYGSELKIRPYTCFYQYDNLPAKDTSDNTPTINICSTQVLEDGRKIKDLLKHNRLRFYIRLKNRPQYYYKLEDGVKVHCTNFKLLVNGKDEVKWSYENELTQIFRENRIKADSKGAQQNTSKSHIFIRCEAEYINGNFTVTCSNFFGRSKSTKRVVETYFENKGVKEINLKLSLHQNESFLTQIPQQNSPTVQQYYIKLDASDLDDYHEYTWHYYVITPDKKSNEFETTNYDFDDVIFQGGETPIMWAMEDGYNLAPKLEPNKIYCFEFIKVFDNLLIGRIKYFVNLVKKN